jgi:hypothetical protein
MEYSGFHKIGNPTPTPLIKLKKKKIKNKIKLATLNYFRRAMLSVGSCRE